MIWISIFLSELLLLFFLSRKLTRVLSSLLFTLTHSTKITIQLLALLLLPGTIIHELAHALTAALLGVKVGKIDLLPHIEEKYVKLGSVQVERVDMLRRFFIGVAPFVVGILLIFGSIYYAAHAQLGTNYWVLFLLGYIVFQIGNTMFSSRKDMEEAAGLLVVLTILLCVMYLLNVQINTTSIITYLNNSAVTHLFYKAVLYLLVPIILDSVLIILLYPFLKRK